MAQDIKNEMNHLRKNCQDLKHFSWLNPRIKFILGLKFGMKQLFFQIRNRQSELLLNSDFGSKVMNMFSSLAIHITIEWVSQLLFAWFKIIFPKHGCHRFTWDQWIFQDILWKPNKVPYTILLESKG